MYQEFNLNDKIKVKLNGWGLEIWKNDHENYNFIVSETFETVKNRHTDENGYTEFITWDFMRIFGQYFSIGFSQPIEEMNVQIEILENRRYFTG